MLLGIFLYFLRYFFAAKFDPNGILQNDKKSKSCIPWANQIEAVLDLSAIPVAPIYLHEYWEHSQDFWGGVSTILERNFFLSEISAKRSYGVKGVVRRAKNGRKFLV